MKIVGIIIAILAFILLVIIHEIGHLLAAKISGVNVLEFSVGMGPLIFQKEKNATLYSLRAIPLGGYCKLEGEDEESDNPKSFKNAPWYKRIIILFAGAFNNIVFCIIVLFFVFLYSGSASPFLANVNPGSPADLAGLKAGDELIAVDGTYYDNWNDIVYAINNSNESVKIGYNRDGNEFSTNVSPIFDETVGRKIIGITSALKHSPKVAIEESWDTSISYFKEIGAFFARLLKGERSEGDEVVGIVGVISVVSEEARNGIINVIFIMALISLNLGVINLLPIPGLDGGKIFFVIIRGLSFGRISDEFESYVDTAGLVLLIALGIFLIFKDTFNIILK